MPESKDAPRTIDTDRVLTVYVHPDASMTVPKADWIWQLNWQLEPERAETTASDRMMAASMAESYRYLIMECTKEEAWHRIRQMRRAVRKYDRSAD